MNQNLTAGFVSSVDVTGIVFFAQEHELLVGTVEELGGDLLVARLLGRG